MEIDLIKPPVEILLGEDNPGDVYIVRSSLTDSQINHNFYQVDNGEAVMAYLHQEQGYQNVSLPDLVLLDLNLPKKNGFEVLEEIKADPKLKTIPVVILTSSNSEKDILRSYQLCANSYIIKPSDYLVFFQAIKNIEIFWLNLAKLPPKLSTNFN